MDLWIRLGPSCLDWHSSNTTTNPVTNPKDPRTMYSVVYTATQFN